MGDQKIKRINFVINSLNRGGTETQLLYLIKSLKTDYKISLFSFSSGSMNDLFKKENINIVTGKKYFGLISFLIFIFKNKADIYHFFLPKSYIIGASLTFFLDVKKIMSRRSLNNYHKKYFYLSLFIEKYLHKRMDLILTNSNVIKNQIERTENVDEKKVKVIKNFVLKKKIFLKKKKKSVKKNIIYVANFFRYKRHLELVDICSSLNVKKRWQLFFVGSDRDTNYSEIKKKIEYYNLHHNIKFLGEIQKVDDIYRKMDFALSASSEEGSSNFLLESISNCLPILAFDVGGNKDFFDKNGFIIPKNDFQTFKEKLEYLINVDDLSTMRKNSFGLILKKFNNKTSISIYKKSYEGLLKN